MMGLCRGWMCCLLSLALFVVSAAHDARAQPCHGQWLPGEGVLGTNGSVLSSTIWDPDGEGPEEPLIVIGGGFKVAGNVYAESIAAYNPRTRTFRPLGTGLPDPVLAVAASPNGDLYAGGYENMSTAFLSRWDGMNWIPIIQRGTYSGFVHSLLILPDGDLVAGGSFGSAGASQTQNLARWSPETNQWSSMGSISGSVNALALLPNGDLVAGGNIFEINSVAFKRIARRDQATGLWHPIGAGFTHFEPTVRSILPMPNGDLIAASGSYVLRWDGVSWQMMGGSSLGHTVYALRLLPNGDILAGGAFSNRIVRWNGTSWSLWNNGPGGEVRSLLMLPDEKLLVGGQFLNMTGGEAGHVALWNGSGWESLCSGSGGAPAWDPAVNALVPLPNGGFVAAGNFTTMGGRTVGHVAWWDGTQWSPLGTGLSSYANAMIALPNNELVVGGHFRNAGGVAANYIARWDGESWHPLGSGTGSVVNALIRDANGDFVVGGSFTTAGGMEARRVARWDGTSWSPIGAGMNGPVNALAFLPNGDLVAGGTFTMTGTTPVNRVARWDGTSWLPMGTGLNNDVYTLYVRPDGQLLAGGKFSSGATGSGWARWDGSAWQRAESVSIPVTAPAVYAIQSRASGDFIVGGSLATSPATGNAFRWDGAAWSELGLGVNGYVYALAESASGELLAGGTFSRSGQTVSSILARWTDTNIPWVARHPQSEQVQVGQTLVLTATPASGYANVSVRWQRNGADIMDGPGGAASGGGVVSGSSGVMPSPADGTPATMVIMGAQPADSGEYVAVFSNACGERSSSAAMVSVADWCGADYNRDTIGGDILDFLDFFEDFAACDQVPAPCGTRGEPDINGDTLIDILDFLDFFEVFGAGC